MSAPKNTPDGWKKTGHCTIERDRWLICAWRIDGAIEFFLWEAQRAPSKGHTARGRSPVLDDVLAMVAEYERKAA